MDITAKLVLVVDDSMLVRHAVCRWLEDQGFRTQFATDGLEALEKVREQLPDLIITDIHMPLMNGAELLQQLRADVSTAEIPVVILTDKQTTLGCGEPHIRVFKDIEMVAQLERALQELELLTAAVR
jgi:CheY-like chemotaxis protein